MSKPILIASLSLALASFFVAEVRAEEKSPADYVNPLIDTHKSRWFYFSSACRPFGMVNLRCSGVRTCCG